MQMLFPPPPSLSTPIVDMSGANREKIEFRALCSFFRSQWPSQVLVGTIQTAALLLSTTVVTHVCKTQRKNLK